MVPIKDSATASSKPTTMWILIAANIAVFFGQSCLEPEQLESLIMSFGLVPARFTDSLGLAAVVSLFTNMFLHGSIGHLLGNMWTLYLFGDNVEDRMGSGRFLGFYLLCGLAASITHIAVNPDSPVPAIGASGAISGVMGAYLLLYPKADIVLMVPILYLPYFFKVQAWVYLGGWFALQYWMGTHPGSAGSVAIWAHIGGFVSGMAVFRLFLKPTGQPSASQPIRVHAQASR